MRQDVRKRFGARLRRLRVERGWTQEQFAERLGIDRSYIGQVERGTRNISIVNLELIADGFGMSLSGLFSRI
jgi:transcriptional regulator with XRE-family HTH domain